MATILTKKSDTASAVPLAADLTNAAGGAELAVNATDKRLFSKTSGGTVVELGTNPSTLVLPSGSANGVAYLNGSKVVTSGSALTFDGTTATVNSGTNNTGLVVSASSSSSSQVNIGVGVLTAGRPFVGTNTNSNPLEIGTRAAADTVFVVNSTEGMRLTSTGLGIGTSSPSQKLTVNGGLASIGPISALTASSTFFDYNTTLNIGRFAVVGNTTGTAAPIVFSQYSSNGSVGRDAAIIDSSGNLGLGVTPSAWSTSAQKALQVYLSGVSSNGGGNTASRFTHGCYLDGSTWKYQDTGVAPTRYEVTGANAGSTHSWSVAAGGTAGNAITFTQAMSLTAAGDLLVGQTSLSQTTVGFSATSAGIVSTAMAASTSAANSYHLYSTGAGAYRFYVGLGGTINATNTTITAISDQRLKENIRDLDEGLATVMALKPRKFDWKAGKGQDIKNARGFIAQEFEQVFPDMIEEWLDPAPEGEEPYKAVNANLIPTLVKAIQELKMEFDAYKVAHP